MKSKGLFRLRLAKEDFKFSSAHFTLFGAEKAERLHGHNYQMAVLLEGRRLDEEGLIADFDQTKGAIRSLCAWLDSRTLLPLASPHLTIRTTGEQVEVDYGDRSYSFPQQDVILLPMVNTSIELLAEMLWEKLVGELKGTLVQVLTVEVGETAGQTCQYRAALPDQPATQ
jgi:6-pyruvoyltetrahydropterin/6-carboxytetrahydropterin synthase